MATQEQKVGFEYITLLHGQALDRVASLASLGPRHLPTGAMGLLQDLNKVLEEVKGASLDEMAGVVSALEFLVLELDKLVQQGQASVRNDLHN